MLAKKKKSQKSVMFLGHEGNDKENDRRYCIPFKQIESIRDDDESSCIITTTIGKEINVHLSFSVFVEILFKKSEVLDCLDDCIAHEKITKDLVGR